ncbi:MAG: hypothetical protein VYE77_11325, partial [Planctomycetota bacterium]|nr:hypothetical protein [Planctomycetota bacterium]
MNGATRWLWSGLGLVVCGLLPAQQQMEAVGDLERQGAPVELSFRAINGARLGGLGYLLVYGKRKAVGGDPLLSLVSTRLQLGYSTSPYHHGDVRLDGDIVLPGGTGRSVFLPLPSLPGVAGYFRGSVAGLPFSEYFEIAEDSTSQPDAILFVTRVGERSATVAQAFGGNRDNFRSVAPDELPADWALLST